MIPTLDQVNVLHRAGRLEDAEHGYRDILEAAPEDVSAHHGLGVLLLQTGRAGEAVPYLRQAAGMLPADMGVLNALGAAHLQTGDVASAIKSFERVLEVKPDDAQALTNLGVSLFQINDLTQAEDTLERSRRLDPNNGDTLYNLSRVLRALGRFDDAYQVSVEALSCMENVGAGATQIADAHHNQAQILLQTGRLAEGWAEYDWRMQTVGFKGAEVFRALPEWTGQPLPNGTLLIWTEQGPGDEILYASMLPELQDMAARVIIACTDRLVPLFRRSFAFAEIVSNTDLMVDRARLGDVSAQCAAGSLGRLFRPTFKSFPDRKSFLRVGQKVSQTLGRGYRLEAKDKPLVGLSWRSGNPRFGTSKSISLRELAGGLEDIDATFVDLQYGDTSDDIEEARGAGLTVVHDPEIDALSDLDAFAAQVAAMDLVITVSNTTAHVAGALGVPCWTLVSAGAGQFWYWFLDRDDSPWYPSLRLFRQATPGDWSSVVGDIKTALSHGSP